MNALSASEGCGIMVCMFLYIFEKCAKCSVFLPNNKTNLPLDIWPKIMSFKTSKISIFMTIYFDIFFATQFLMYEKNLTFKWRGYLKENRNP